MLQDVAAQAATCTAPGWKAYKKCANCEYKEGYEEIPAGHVLQDVAAQAATCTAPGWKAYKKCANCEYKEGYEEIPAGHVLQDVAAQAATCTAPGWKAYKKCANCDYTEGYEEIPAGHVLQTVIGRAATCTARGWKAYKKCVNCDYTEGYETIPASGHELTGYLKEDSTCGKTGHEAYWKCSRCGKLFSDEAGQTEITGPVVIPLKDHTPAKAVRENVVASTAAAEGHYDSVVYCTACGAELSRTVVTTEKQCTSHTPGQPERKNETPATCTKEGSYDEVVYCSACGRELSRTTKTIAKTDHVPVTVPGKEPTETEQGLTEGTQCSVCGEWLEPQKEIPIRGGNTRISGSTPKIAINSVSYGKGSDTGTVSEKKELLANMKSNSGLYAGVTYKVTSIGDAAFTGDKKVTSITVPGVASKIGSNAFSKTPNLKTLKTESTKLKAKDLSPKAFEGLSKKTVIKVKKSKLKDYKTMFPKKGLPKNVRIKKLE